MFDCATNCSTCLFVGESTSFNTLSAFVGSVPATYSSWLLIPSPSKSSAPSARVLVLKPYCNSHGSPTPSPSASTCTVNDTVPLFTPPGPLAQLVTAARIGVG